MLIKKHLTSENKLMIAVCDTELFGKVFEEGELQLNCSSDFYNGEESDENTLKELVNQCVNANIVGEKSIAAVKALGFLKDANIKTIDNIPYAQFFKMVAK
jgi:uncharacterized protein